MSTLIAGFETGALLSWGLPLAILFAVVIWWVLTLRRGDRE
jgi:hypothetical protein